MKMNIKKIKYFSGHARASLIMLAGIIDKTTLMPTVAGKIMDFTDIYGYLGIPEGIFIKTMHQLFHGKALFPIVSYHIETVIMNPIFLDLDEQLEYHEIVKNVYFGQGNIEKKHNNRFEKLGSSGILETLSKTFRSE